MMLIGLPVSSVNPVVRNSSLNFASIACGVLNENRSATYAAAPATCGAAIEVPDIKSHPFEPGPTLGGFPEYGVACEVTVEYQPYRPVAP